MDSELWDLTQNPWVVLQTVSRQRLEKLASDSAFREMLEELMEAKRAQSELPQWFQQTHPNSPLKTVAYFSMEYMLSEALPIYSGGLGNVAGDQLKAANDLGVPVIAVGLLYQQGYFRQEIDRDGAQRALYPYNDPGQMPIKPLRDASGDWLRLPIALPGFKLWIRSWEVQVGQTKLYLLDTNDPANLPEYRGITSELYGGGPELRLRRSRWLRDEPTIYLLPEYETEEDARQHSAKALQGNFRRTTEWLVSRSVSVAGGSELQSVQALV